MLFCLHQATCHAKDQFTIASRDFQTSKYGVNDPSLKIYLSVYPIKCISDKSMKMSINIRQQVYLPSMGNIIS